MTNAVIPYLVFQILLAGWAGYWWIHRRDEVPLLITGFFLFCGSFRGMMLALGLAEPVSLGGGLFAGSGDTDFVEALGLIVLGESLLIASYCLVQRKILRRRRGGFPKGRPTWLVWSVFGMFAGIFPIAFITRGHVSAQASEGKSLAFEVSSYAILWPMGLVGVAILLLCIWRFGLLAGWFEKVGACLILASIAWFTYGPSLRFLFLGWILAGGLIWSATARPERRYWGLIVAGIMAVAAFGLAGAMRQEDSEKGIKADAISRITSAEDANMLDGFVMLRQVFPALLSHTWGEEHLAILTRPIPRAIWPNKPVGGYMNKLGLFDAGSSGTTGISPTLFGTFYQEAGVLGIIVLSVAYGYGFGCLVSWAAGLAPFASVVVRASAFAGLVPLMRSGDLPGVCSWLGMAFWPCALILLLLKNSSKRGEQMRVRKRRPKRSKGADLRNHESRGFI